MLLDRLAPIVFYPSPDAPIAKASLDTLPSGYYSQTLLQTLLGLVFPSSIDQSPRPRVVLVVAPDSYPTAILDLAAHQPVGPWPILEWIATPLLQCSFDLVVSILGKSNVCSYLVVLVVDCDCP